MARKTTKPSLKPSGYDVVIRNVVAIKRINREAARADARKRDVLLTEKDRLIDEMQTACPHESVVRCDDVRSSLFGPRGMPTSLCTSCGLYEQPPTGAFTALKGKRGRSILPFARADFLEKLGEVLRRTGINAPST